MLPLDENPARKQSSGLNGTGRIAEICVFSIEHSTSANLGLQNSTRCRPPMSTIRVYRGARHESDADDEGQRTSAIGLRLSGSYYNGQRSSGDRPPAPSLGVGGPHGGSAAQPGSFGCQAQPSLLLWRDGTLRGAADQTVRDRAGADSIGARLLSLWGMRSRLLSPRPGAGIGGELLREAETAGCAYLSPRMAKGGNRPLW